MKTANLFFSSLILFVLISCRMDPIIRVGLDTDFGHDSNGSSNIHVGNNALTVTLTGDITLTEGQVLVELINPVGDTLFTRHLVSPISLNVNESFLAVPGHWKLNYKSIEGTGSLSMHLYFVTQIFFL